MNGVPAFPAQVEIDEKLRVLSEAARQLATTQDSAIKDRALRTLNEAYIWLATYRIDFRYDRKTDSFRV